MKRKSSRILLSLALAASMSVSGAAGTAPMAFAAEKGSTTNEENPRSETDSSGSEETTQDEPAASDDSDEHAAGDVRSEGGTDIDGSEETSGEAKPEETSDEALTGAASAETKSEEDSDTVGTSTDDDKTGESTSDEIKSGEKSDEAATKSSETKSAENSGDDASRESGTEKAGTSEQNTASAPNAEGAETGKSGSKEAGVLTPSVPETVQTTAADEETMVFDAAALEDGTISEKTTYDLSNGMRLTLCPKDKVDKKSSKDKWSYPGGDSFKRISLKSKAGVDSTALCFTVSETSNVKIWWVAGKKKSSSMVFLDENGEKVKEISVDSGSEDQYTVSRARLDKGTYYLGMGSGSVYFFRTEISKAGEVTAWNEVEDPELTDVSSSDGTVSVKVHALVDAEQGGDSVMVKMFNEEGTEIDSQTDNSDGAEHTLKFQPSRSGKYSFKAYLLRGTETAKESKSQDTDFILPLAAPQIKSVVNTGNGSIKLSFYSVTEADKYLITLKDPEGNVTEREVSHETMDTDTDNEYSERFKGLTVGKQYTVSVKALRGAEQSKNSEMTVDIMKEAETEWIFSCFGSNASTDRNYAGAEAEKSKDGKSLQSVDVWNLNGKGKIVPNSTDGLSFFYTPVPTDKNFVLTATAHIHSWKLSNGQEGFGLMAADRVGVNGQGGSFWNNSYMATVTKVDYYFDPETGEATDDTTKNHITMKLGVGSQEKTGVTGDNLSALEASDQEAISQFRSKMTPLDVSAGEKGTGTYNLVGNSFDVTKHSEKHDYKKTLETAGTYKSVTDFTLTIRKNNTGYFVTYTDEDGEEHTKKYYNTEALSQIDQDYVYAGFFASRNADVSFDNITLDVHDPSEDPAAEERPVEYTTPSYRVVSSAQSNSADYDYAFLSNADGVLTVYDPSDKVLADKVSLQAGSKFILPATLSKGRNHFRAVFKPDADFHPDGLDYKKLSDYSEQEIDFDVDYQTIAGNSIYVSPEGSSSGTGDEASPLDIYTAVQYAAPGQTILLKGGTYTLNRTVVIEPGHDGTRQKPIIMKAESSEERPVFDFSASCEGMRLAGNWWEFRDFDVTNSGEALHGITLSGSYCLLENLHTYKNRNTGLQVSRYSSDDKRGEWPSYDLILNCTSYLNADRGYEDADGFASKLTCGEGIVFDGCISYNNADDGWDCFAKKETGSIGSVLIRNSLAFSNGYGADGTLEGNGNGFKMGGDSLPGAHRLYNSVSFNNKAKGIDSNSCPDIKAFRSTSFNNMGANAAFYTNDAKNTNFEADGIISYRDKAPYNTETFKLLGSQDKDKVYTNRNFFYYDQSASKNADGTVSVSGDWFESLEAPKIDAADPAAVGESLRSDHGAIDLGGFLKLTECARTAMKDAGVLDPESIGAVLDGTEEQYQSVEDIPGFHWEDDEPVEPDKKPEESENKSETKPEESENKSETKPEHVVEHHSSRRRRGRIHTTSSAVNGQTSQTVQTGQVVLGNSHRSGTTQGAWSMNSDGTWNFTTSDGYHPVSEWYAASYNGVVCWYHFDASGKMQTGWFQNAAGEWYYLNPSSDGKQGQLVTGTVVIDGKTYSFETEGEKAGRLIG